MRLSNFLTPDTRRKKKDVTTCSTCIDEKGWWLDNAFEQSPAVISVAVLLPIFPRSIALAEKYLLSQLQKIKITKSISF
jgi:hypothetical protein